jgi:Centromere protein H (CENP-H)
MVASLYKNRRPKAASARISAALECTAAIVRQDVDTFLSGVNIKLDGKGEVQDLSYGTGRRRYADLVVDIGYRPDLGDVLGFDTVTGRATLARHVTRHVYALWRLSQSSELQQETPLHNNLKVMWDSVILECGGQGAKFDTEFAFQAYVWWKMALLYYRTNKDWRCHPADRGILEAFPDYYKWWRRLSNMGGAARTAALAAEAAAVSSADVAVEMAPDGDEGGDDNAVRRGGSTHDDAGDVAGDNEPEDNDAGFGAFDDHNDAEDDEDGAAAESESGNGSEENVAENEGAGAGVHGENAGGDGSASEDGSRSSSEGSDSEEAGDGGAPGAGSVSKALPHSLVEALLGGYDSILRPGTSYRRMPPLALALDRCRELSQDPSSALELEQGIARWLDEKTLQMEQRLTAMERASAATAPAPTGAATAPAPSGPATAPAPSGPAPHLKSDADPSIKAPPPLSDSTPTVQDMEDELVRRTSQQQLEHRFLSMALTSKQAQRDDRKSVHSDDDRHGDVSKKKQLRHGAIKARDREVSRALQLEAELADIREQQREAKAETSRLQGKNRKLKKAVRAAESEKQRRQQSSSDSGGQAAESETQGQQQSSSAGSGAQPTPMEAENRVLVPLLRDAVLGSGLDWFEDDRLCEMATRKDLP